MLFCERAFGTFFILWGGLLIVDTYLPISHHGLFYGQMEAYMPTLYWGLLILALGIGRWLAFYRRSNCWRTRLSMLTFVLLVVIATLAFLTGLYAATAPLAAFVAYFAFWCHTALLRDLRLGL